MVGTDANRRFNCIIFYSFNCIIFDNEIIWKFFRLEGRIWLGGRMSSWESSLNKHHGFPLLSEMSFNV